LALKLMIGWVENEIGGLKCGDISVDLPY